MCRGHAPPVGTSAISSAFAPSQEKADSVSGRRIWVLADDQHAHLVERKAKGAQHIFSGRQVTPAGGDLRAEKLPHLGYLLLDGLQCTGPTIRPGGHASPFANSTTVSVPERLCFETSWQTVTGSP